MSQIFTITGVTGGVPPLSLYICDENLNNCTFIGNSGGTYTASTFYSTATSFIIKIVDSLGCLFFTAVSCPVDTFIILTEDSDNMTTEDGFFLVFRDD